MFSQVGTELDVLFTVLKRLFVLFVTNRSFDFTSFLDCEGLYGLILAMIKYIGDV